MEENRQQAVANAHKSGSRGKSKYLPRGKPWPKGTSGNPAGGSVLSSRAEALYAEISSEMGTLSAVDRALLQQASNMLTRAKTTRNPKLVVPYFNAGLRALGSIRQGLQPTRQKPPVTAGLAEYLAAHDAADDDGDA